MMPRLRKLIRISLILVVCAGMQGTILVEALFLIHQDHIAEHHCVNRNNPDVQCDGMCFLVKRIEDAHGSHDHASLSMRAADVDIRAIAFSYTMIPVAASTSNEYGPYHTGPVPDPPPVDIFRPPWMS
ncbi:hypothetical protein [Longibacter salinarum]|nr:hypothetical protein [Longibacter salinarum]